MRKLGDALKAAVSEGYESEEGIAAKSALMNANRRRAFEYVAWHPCATAAEVARALRVGEPTAVWHLRKLVEAGYVHDERGRRGRAFLAAGLSLGTAEVAGLAALSEPEAPSILAIALKTPGLTANQLARRAGRKSALRPVRALLAAGFLVAVADGRYRRYFPGGAVSALQRTAPGRLRDWRRRLVRKLEADRLAPEVQTAPGDVVEIELRFGEERATLRLPAGSLLAGRLG